MGVLIPLMIFLVVVVPLGCLLEWLCAKYSKVERRVKRLEEALFDGPKGG